MRFPITSVFGDKTARGTPHTGIDLAMPVGTPIRAFCDGTVDKVTDYGRQNLGRGVIVRTHDGTRYIYGHLDRVEVREGQAVHPGDELGLSGNTGNSTGPHLHFGETVNGRYVDPSDVIARVDAHAGDAHSPTLWDMLTHPLNVQDVVESAMNDALAAIGDTLLHLSYGVALIGSGVLILLQLLGFEHRWLKPPLLVGAYVIMRYMFS